LRVPLTSRTFLLYPYGFSAVLNILGPYLFVGNARRTDHILRREAPVGHPDAGSLKVLEYKMSRICGEQGSRDVVLMQILLTSPLEVVNTGSATSLSL